MIIIQRNPAVKMFHTRVVEVKCEEVLEFSISYNTDIPQELRSRAWKNPQHKFLKAKKFTEQRNSNFLNYNESYPNIKTTFHILYCIKCDE